MRKIMAGILLGGAILCQPITAQANSLSIIPTEEETGVPVDVYQNANVIGHEFDICPELLMAVAETESQFTATAENGSCKGLMQVSINFHKQRFTDAGWSSLDWTDPYKNMYVAADYLHDLFEEHEDAATVLMLYHGEKNAVSKGKSGNVSSYAKGILERSEELERFHGK
jgi:soluble lytic murein transglycosylase-like protein